ncbi:ribonuclease H [Bordetella genomosp. 5]|uniref:retron Ec67 family RNA-directed DNA polymerase/endonuclease n=1 Tax=Bordetella genomosp. 5 TaxID=1395608 RepID=UPI000B9DE33B|nr:retron Ec67 family RNA-directed DNA polymerase/endonuclease [Bordetella genomosp. 5]OZI39581.1 ribonuclease H [Bordetella genomosp. 5]
MTPIQALQRATTLHDLATILSFQPKTLSYLLYVASDTQKYRSFELPKKTGGTRTISAPTDKLKRLQSNLADLLQRCLDDLKISAEYSDSASHGFQRGKSIISNAAQHRAKRYVFNIDIANFFGAINFGRIRGFLIKDTRFALHPTIATIIAQIACRENSLPQGSPCSPIIANLVGNILDRRLIALAAKYGCTYTRYADDLTFSTNKKVFPPRIASRTTDHTWAAGEELLAVLQASRFSPNPQKTRMQYKTSRQEVTGLIANKKVNVRSDYRKRVRAMVHRLFSTGSFNLPENPTPGAGRTRDAEPGTLNQLHGMLSFIDSVDQYNIQRSKLKLDQLSQKEKTYRKFLLYKDFYLAEQAIILCEGKTDNIYLRNAIKGLPNDFPLLGSNDSPDQFKINVRFYRYAESSTGRILGLSGGTGDFPNFINAYLTALAQFPALKIRHPVIILIDNDSGARPLYSSLAQRLHRKIDPRESFIHVESNLYVVATPIIEPASESMIEDFFDETTKKLVVKNRHFDPRDDADQRYFYGKNTFATEVVERFSDSIDFSGFSELLCRIEMAIRHFHSAHSPANS